MPAFNREHHRAALWPQPSRTQTAEGAPRRLGIEIEFSGLGMQQIADIMGSVLGGVLDPHSKYEYTLRNASLGAFSGDFGIELDSAYMKKRGREQDPDAEDDLENLADNVVSLVAEQVVPFEVVSPPIPLPEVWRMNTVVQKLREGGARGTRQTPLYAFGLHLNPELPDLQATTILAYLRAFLCLFDWLAKRSEVDLSRRITPYIDPFPRAYMDLLLDPAYAPERDQLIDDYLAHNPTRNRALDMLPLFRHLDEERVIASIDDDRIKARPTFHYRLPNCQIDEADWSLIHAWRDWLQVEALAADEERLAALMEAWNEHTSGITGGLFADWPKRCATYLLPELL